MLGKKCSFGKVLNRVVKRLCKCFDKWTTSWRTGFIKLDRINCLVLYLNTLHILSADIYNTVNLRVKECSSIEVGHSFNFTFIKHKCWLDKSLTITCWTGLHNLSLRWKLCINVFNSLDCSIKRRTVVAWVKWV